MKKFSGALLLIVFLPYVVLAHVPLVVEPESPREINPIDRVHVSQAFYGNLDGFPHTYEFSVSDSQDLYVQILVPDIDRAENIISGIVVKKLERGGVEEVARLHAKDGAWESFYEPFGGDRYRGGPEFEGNIVAGEYVLEVSTPDNLAPYVLVVGKEENFEGVGYFETIRRIAEVKEFYGKSQFRIIESPFVYVPVGIFTLIFVGVLLWRRKRLSKDARGEVV